MRLDVIDRNLEEYHRTLLFQRELVDLLVADSEAPCKLVVVQHPHVYTCGRGAMPEKRWTAAEENPPLLETIKWYETNRGGKTTFHGPGQLVFYPIFNLQRHGKDVHKYLRNIETAVIKAFEKFGLVSTVVPGATGVWVDESHKVASIGVGVKRWVSYHGFSVNVSVDKRFFKVIDACGSSGDLLANLEDFIPEINIADVKKTIISAVSEEFAFSEIAYPHPVRKKPSWLTIKGGESTHFSNTENVIRDKGLVTVCEEARCPNIGECWSHSTATFMIMGELCTRRCSFCSVKDGTLAELQDLDPFEPYKVGKAVKELGLSHVVVTSVNRDDLADMGAEHFDQTVNAIKSQNPDCRVELLIPDMRGRRELLEIILRSGQVSVLNHNTETVPRLYKQVRPGAIFQRSLDILKWAKEIDPSVKPKTGIMVGLGETVEEVIELMERAREAGVEIFTIGQYLRPSSKQLPVARYVAPDEFELYEKVGSRLGFKHTESGAFVRSSFHAWKHADGAEGKLTPVQNGETQFSLGV